MKIEWTFRDGRYIGSAGDLIAATVTECNGRQMATVYLLSRSLHESVEYDYDPSLPRTVEEAKQSAQEIVDEALAPFIAAAVAAEREACAVRIKQAADQLDAAAARIGELAAECDMARAMIDDLNDDLALAMQQRNAARAEGAAAEREACAKLAQERARYRSPAPRTAVRAACDEAARIANEIRARSKDATR